MKWTCFFTFVSNWSARASKSCKAKSSWFIISSNTSVKQSESSKRPESSFECEFFILFDEWFHVESIYAEKKEQRKKTFPNLCEFHQRTFLIDWHDDVFKLFGDDEDGRFIILSLSLEWADDRFFRLLFRLQLFYMKKKSNWLFSIETQMNNNRWRTKLFLVDNRNDFFEFFRVFLESFFDGSSEFLFIISSFSLSSFNFLVIWIIR